MPPRFQPQPRPNITAAAIGIEALAGDLGPRYRSASVRPTPMAMAPTTATDIMISGPYEFGEYSTNQDEAVADCLWRRRWANDFQGLRVWRRTSGCY
jgi:hypothetical protein